MTAEQLQQARAAHWRQQQNPILTLDDAAGWLEQHPLCLYLPRRAQLPAPAPSFVEATLGTAAVAPAMSATAPAQGLLTRLLESGSVVALNLFGAVGEQPDFLVARQALPYVLCLRADADWKHAPEKSSGHKVSPLVLELWKALDKEGSLTAAEARETLGRELTEAAVLRGLGELWQGLRISPVWTEAGQPARWELLRVRHRDALATAAATGQVTALSLLVSIYLQSVYAASGEEIEIFLSPLASRSRVREAVRGLSATRQIHSLSMDAQTYYFLEGGLPEFAASAVPLEAKPPLPGPPAVRFSTPPRPLPRTASGKDQRVRPAGTEWKQPRRPEKSLSAPPSLPPARSLPPAPRPGAKSDRGPQRSARPASREGRPGARPPSRPSTGSETRPAGPEVGRGWKKPSWPGKPAAARSAYPSPRRYPPSSAQAGERTSRGPQRSDALAHGGARPDKRAPFRSPPRPRPDRPGGPPRDRGGRPDGPVSGGHAGSGLSMGRPPGGKPAAFRAPARPSRPGASSRGASGPGQSRPGLSRPGQSRPGQARPGQARPGQPRPGQSGPGRSVGPTARTGYPDSRRPRPSTPGDSQPARPAFVPSSRPAKPWLRTGPSSTRPSGKPGGKAGGRGSGRPGGKAGGKPGAKPGAKSGNPSGNFPRRKPARKKPGA